VASDYSLRRWFRNTTRPAWNWWFGQVPLSTAPPEELPAGLNLIQPSRKIPRPRASAIAFTLTQDNVTVIAGNKALPVRRFEVPTSRQKGYGPRTARTAYDIPNAVPPAAAVVAEEVLQRRIEGPRLPTRRSARTAYFIDNRPQIPSDVPPGTVAFAHRAPGARRTGREAYEIRNIAVVPDLPVPVNPTQRIMPVSAPGKRRAANEAYRIRNTFVVPDVVIPVPPFAGLYPARYEVRRRPANTAYSLTRAPLLGDVPPPPTLPKCAEFVNPNLSGPMYVNPELHGPMYVSPEVC